MISRLKRLYLAAEILWQRSKLARLSDDVDAAEQAAHSLAELREQRAKARRKLMNLEGRHSALQGQ